MPNFDIINGGATMLFVRTEDSVNAGQSGIDMKDQLFSAKKLGLVTCMLIASSCFSPPTKIETRTMKTPLLDAALLQAKQEEKPVILYFYADWCIPCKKFKGVLYSPEVASLLSRKFIYVNVNLDSEEGKILSDRFNISGSPVVLLVDRDGKAQEQIVSGYANQFEDPSYFVKQLNTISQGQDSFSVDQKQWKMSSNLMTRLKSAYRLATSYALVGNEEKALEWLAHVKELDPEDEYQALTGVYDALANELYGKQLKNEEKKAEYLRKMALYPKSTYTAGIESQKAHQLQSVGRTDEALAVYRDLLVKAPENVSAIYNFSSFCLSYNVNYQEALSYVRRGVEIDPAFDRLWVNLSKLYRRLGMCDQAYEAAVQASKINQNNDQAKIAREKSQACR